MFRRLIVSTSQGVESLNLLIDPSSTTQWQARTTKNTFLQSRHGCSGKQGWSRVCSRELGTALNKRRVGKVSFFAFSHWDEIFNTMTFHSTRPAPPPPPLPHCFKFNQEFFGFVNNQNERNGGEREKENFKKQERPIKKSF